MAKKAHRFPAKVGKDCFFDVLPHGEMQITDNGIAMLTNLASMGTPFNEIATLLGCTPNTLRNQFNRKKVEVAYERGKAAGHLVIRKALFDRIKKGSDKCIIFASKAELGMSDTVLPSTEASALESFVRAIDRAKEDDEQSEEDTDYNYAEDVEHG